METIKTATEQLTDADIDAMVDRSLRASGSALRNYTMWSTIESMRAAMRENISTALASARVPVGQDAAARWAAIQKIPNIPDGVYAQIRHIMMQPAPAPAVTSNASTDVRDLLWQAQYHLSMHAAKRNHLPQHQLIADIDAVLKSPAPAVAVNAQRKNGEPLWSGNVETVTMNGHQLREALGFINPDGADDPDQLDDELTFGIVRHADDDGKESKGLCCWNDDTDGVYPLHGDGPYAAQPAAPAGEPVAWLYECPDGFRGSSVERLTIGVGVLPGSKEIPLYAGAAPVANAGQAARIEAFARIATNPAFTAEGALAAFAHIPPLAPEQAAQPAGDECLISRDNFYTDPIEDIAHALAHELEEAELNPDHLVTVNRKKLTAIAQRVLEKARAAIAAQQPAQDIMRKALEKIIEMNRQHAEDQYGDANKAESWSCVIVAREAIATQRPGATS